jgi:A-macroglobulin receptor binding domain
LTNNFLLAQVVIYFEFIGRSEVCPTISAYRTHRVANQKPAAVLVYDYYDQVLRFRNFFHPDGVKSYSFSRLFQYFQAYRSEDTFGGQLKERLLAYQQILD